MVAWGGNPHSVDAEELTDSGLDKACEQGVPQPAQAAHYAVLPPAQVLLVLGRHKLRHKGEFFKVYIFFKVYPQGTKCRADVGP
jgi:hypothetical protein